MMFPASSDIHPRRNGHCMLSCDRGEATTSDTARGAGSASLSSRYHSRINSMAGAPCTRNRIGSGIWLAAYPHAAAHSPGVPSTSVSLRGKVQLRIGRCQFVCSSSCTERLRPLTKPSATQALANETSSRSIPQRCQKSKFIWPTLLAHTSTATQRNLQHMFALDFRNHLHWKKLATGLRFEITEFNGKGCKQEYARKQSS